MEHLATYLDRLEESYDDFFRKAVEATTYAEEVIDNYDSPFETENLLVETFPQSELEERLYDTLETAQSYSSNVRDDLFKLSIEMQKYSNCMNLEDLPERYWEIDTRLGEIRELHEEQEEEIRGILEQLDETEEKPETGPTASEHQAKSHQAAEGNRA